MTSRGSIGAYQGRSGSERVSDAAKKNAPPGSKSGNAAAFAFVMGSIISPLLALMAGSFGVYLFAMMVTVAVTVFAGVTTKDDEGIQDKYARQWYCFKCGRNFHEPENFPSAPIGTEDEVGKADID